MGWDGIGVGIPYVSKAWILWGFGRDFIVHHVLIGGFRRCPHPLLMQLTVEAEWESYSLSVNFVEIGFRET